MTSAAEVKPTDQVSIEVDGKTLPARRGQMLIEVTDAFGPYVPRFCYHKKLSVAANCRMCLVEVEKAPKPLPACATPVMDGMKVHTRSVKARDAQKGTMEFLLINHPLDCPICDQGGECPLQDLALGYGDDISRYSEGKRVIDDKDIGPLISTEMTRCIHCTRCVRFGQEVAGVMEFGAIGRGEHMEIRTFLDRSVDSELSGNVIDLCPVGALTSKPYRFKARAWELTDQPSVSPHDCVGANILVQSLRGKVMRVLPRENEAVNECWISDRDRFSYEALNSEERLRVPLIRVSGRLQETDWQTALAFTAQALKRVIAAHGADQLGALAAPISTLEEFFLLQKLVRGLGSNNVDHRLRQMDFRDDARMPLFPAFGQPLKDLEHADAILLVGSNVRKDQPLIGLRVRKAALKGANISVINPMACDFNFDVAHQVVVHPLETVSRLAGVAQALAARKNVQIPEPLKRRFGAAKPDPTDEAIAETLAGAERGAVVLGNLAASHPQSAELRAAAQWIAKVSGAALWHLPDANSAGGWLAGCVPHRGSLGRTVAAGRHALAMLRKPLKAYLLLGVEPELDCLYAGPARAAMDAAEFVVALSAFRPSPFRTAAADYADVVLPLAPFTETAGSFVNGEGRVQSFEPAVTPVGETRPGWKILRMLGNVLGLDGFAQSSVEEIRTELNLTTIEPSSQLSDWQMPEAGPTAVEAAQRDALWRIAEVPLYATDTLVRRAPALQASSDNPAPAARVNAGEAAKRGLNNGEQVRICMMEGECVLEVLIDERVPDGCLVVASGYPQTAALGAHGPATVLKVKG
jgi:NADH-quinone oxidoreductase subunit G